jgi:hypothetical protein
MKVEDMTYRYPGSVDIECCQCKAKISVSPASQRQLENPHNRAACNKCALEMVEEQTAAGEDVTVAITQRQQPR